MTYSDDPQAYWTVRGGTYCASEEWIRRPNGLTSSQGVYLVDQFPAARFVLEIGCGYGRLLREIASRLPGLRLMGIDFSTTQLDAAREYLKDYPLVSVMYADATVRIPFEDRAFDVVYTQGCAMHVPSGRIDRLCREAARVSSGVIAHIEEQNHTDDSNFVHDFERLYAPHGFVLSDRRPYPFVIEGQHMTAELFIRR